jgi:hypothetical protein
MRIFLANYPNDLKMKLDKAFPEVTFENNYLKMEDSRGFALIIDRAFRVKECLNKYKEPVTWMDTDILVRGDLSELLDVGSEELKILYRKGSPERVRINAGVFTIGYSAITHKFITTWYNEIKVGHKWGDGQLVFWKIFKKYMHRKDIKLTDITFKFNSAGAKFNEEYVVWHCKKAHFDREKYQVEYKEYLVKAKQYIKDTWRS